MAWLHFNGIDSPHPPAWCPPGLSWRHGIFCLLIALLVAANGWQIRALTLFGEPISPRYCYYGIPIALSEMVYGRPRDYSATMLAR